MLTEAERKRLTSLWETTAANYQGNSCLVELFEAQVSREPDSVALSFQGQELTYFELNRRANRFAHYLRGLNVGPESLVAVCLDRSPEMIVALLGILKAGGAYLPLDPAYPKDRLAFMLEDANPAVVITRQGLLSAIPNTHTHVICLDSDWDSIASSSDENPLVEVSGDNLAYVIYTSGSTGKPKGVAIEHASAGALIHWASDLYTPADLTGVLASTSICFDLSVFELFVPLSWGGRVVLAENALHLLSLDAATEVTLINTVPSAMTELVRANAIPASVRVVNLAGEPLQNALVQRIYQQESVQRVFNLYGPSEDTTYSTYALLKRDSNKPPSIGRPIANSQVFILDKGLQPAPVGVIGEFQLIGKPPQIKCTVGCLTCGGMIIEAFSCNQAAWF
jgi:amino acid adenylation domain-containing protein